LHGDAGALATLFSNLLNNAIKYTPRGGSVRVSVEPGEDGTALLVEDSGPGIPAEDRERVFDRFCRRAGSETFGSGLGLAIARGIAARHRAEIELSASPELGGLAARVHFPA
jgi:two-component system OmpR family sensor kinase